MTPLRAGLLVCCSLVLLTAVLGGQAAGAEGPIVECTTIDESGSYTLAGDLEANETCLEVTADDVHLDGEDATVAGDDDPEDPGIAISNAENVTVQSLTLTDWDVGLQADDVDHSVVTAVTVTDSAEMGMLFIGSTQNQIHDVTVSETGESAAADVGIDLRFDADDNELRNVTATDNGGSGVRVQHSSGNSFDAVSASGNGWYGIDLVNAADSSLSNVTITDNERGIDILESTENTTITSSQVADNSLWDLNAAGDTTVDTLDIGETAISFAGEDVTASGVVDPPENEGEDSIDHYVDLEVEDRLTLDVHYDSTALGTVEETTLELAHHDGDEWTPLENASLDTDAAVLSGSVSDDGTVGAFGHEDISVPIESLEHPDSFAAGETLNVTATVKNAAEEQVTEPVALRVEDPDGTTVAENESELSISPGELATTTLEWETSPGDDTSEPHAVVAETPDDENSSTVQVEPTPGTHVEVTNLTANDPVYAGESVTLEADLENLGADSDTEDLTLSVNGSPVENWSVDIEAGATTSTTVEWTPASPGPADAAVASTEDEATTTVSVEPAPPSFAVSLDAVEDPVVAGSNVTTETTVENTGGQTGTQDIVLSADGAPVNATAVTLEEGESTTVSLSAPTEDPGDLSLTVESENESDEEVTTVEPTPAYVDVTIDDVTDPVLTNQTLTVNATVENTGQAEADQPISLVVENETADTETVVLDGGESATLKLEWEPTDAGTTMVALESLNASATTDVVVDAPAHFELSGVTTSSPVEVDETLTVDATVTNVGTLSGTDTVRMAVDGETHDSETVSLNGSESTAVSFEWNASEPTEETLTLSTDDDQHDRDVEVVIPEPPADYEPAHLAPVIDPVADPVPIADPLAVTVDIENTGEEGVSRTVDLTLDNETVASEREYFGPESASSLSFSVDLESDDVGERTLGVDTLDGTDEIDIEVVDAFDGPDWDVSFENSPETGIVGENVTYRLEITNEGDTAATDMDFVSNVETEQIFSEFSGPVDPGETVVSEVTVDDAVSEAGEHEWWVAKYYDWVDADGTPQLSNLGDHFSTTVSFLEPVDLTVTEAVVRNETVEPGGTVGASVTIENEGAEAGGDQLELVADGDVIAEKSFEVDAQSSKTIDISRTADRSYCDQYMEWPQLEPDICTASDGDEIDLAVLTVGDGEMTDAGTVTVDDPDDTPGFGVGAGVLAVVIALAVGAHRRP